MHGIKAYPSVWKPEPAIKTEDECGGREVGASYPTAGDPPREILPRNLASRSDLSHSDYQRRAPVLKGNVAGSCVPLTKPSVGDFGRRLRSGNRPPTGDGPRSGSLRLGDGQTGHGYLYKIGDCGARLTLADTKRHLRWRLAGRLEETFDKTPRQDRATRASGSRRVRSN